MKEKFEKATNVKNRDNSEKYILGGERKAIYHDKILSNQQKSTPVVHH